MTTPHAGVNVPETNTTSGGAAVDRPEPVSVTDRLDRLEARLDMIRPVSVEHAHLAPDYREPVE